MATALAIITAAIRESNIIPMGAVPNANQIAEALGRLKALIASAYDSYPLKDWPVGTTGYHDSQAWTSTDWIRVRANARIVYNMATATTVYLPENPQDGARIGLVDIGNSLAAAPLTLNGNGRLIETANSVTLNTNGLTAVWVYNGDAGNWARIVGFADETATMPFPDAYEDYFVTRLAVRINPRYGRALSQETALRLQEMENMFNARYRQKRDMPAPHGAIQMNRVKPGRSVDPYNPGIDL